MMIDQCHSHHGLGAKLISIGAAATVNLLEVGGGPAGSASEASLRNMGGALGGEQEHSARDRTSDQSQRFQLRAVNVVHGALG